MHKTNYNIAVGSQGCKTVRKINQADK